MDIFIIGPILTALVVIVLAVVNATVSKSTRDHDNEEIRDFLEHIERTFYYLVDNNKDNSMLYWNLQQLIFVPENMEICIKHRKKIDAKIDELFKVLTEADKIAENMLLSEAPCNTNT